jgi:hypothetical protein
MPGSKKRLPRLNSLFTKNSKKNNIYISLVEENLLKFMNKQNITSLFLKIDKMDKKIIGLDIEMINSSNVLDTFNTPNKALFKTLYSKKKYEPDRLVVRVKKITYSDLSTKTIRSPIYFFKSTGESRRMNSRQKTTDIWFPTNIKPFELDFEKVKRITKLEDPILDTKIRPLDKDININEYGRFLTLENAMISRFLSQVFK